MDSDAYRIAIPDPELQFWSLLRFLEMCGVKKPERLDDFTNLWGTEIKQNEKLMGILKVLSLAKKRFLDIKDTE